eukprot:4356023-Pyramimonas_sp.AAC.1
MQGQRFHVRGMLNLFRIAFSRCCDMLGNAAFTSNAIKHGRRVEASSPMLFRRVSASRSGNCGAPNFGRR